MFRIYFPPINLYSYPRKPMSLPIQKVMHLADAKKKKSFTIKTDYAIMEKYDGWLILIDCIEGRWQQVSSSAGRPIPSMEWLTERFHRLHPTRVSTRFIFEATIPDTPFHIANGLFNRKYEQCYSLELNLHDVIQLEYYKTPFIDRYKAIESHYLSYLREQLADVVKLVPILNYSKCELTFDFHFKQIVSEGGEGIILKNVLAPYSFGKRNTDILKIKEDLTLDLEIINYFWSKGEKGNDAMNLELKWKKYDSKITVVVAKHSDINTISNLGTEVIGKIAEIKAMKDLGNGALREPRFKCFRFDKNIGE